jgi:hypothetical protein
MTTHTDTDEQIKMVEELLLSKEDKCPEHPENSEF